MSYKVVHEDKDTFTLQHPDGSHFAVAKHRLDKGTIGKIQSLKEPVKMADGGEVPDEEDVETPAATPAASVDIATTPEAAMSQSTGLAQPFNEFKQPSQQGGLGITPVPGQQSDLEKIIGAQEAAVKQSAQAQAQAQANISKQQEDAAKQLADFQSKAATSYEAFDKQDKELMKQYGEGKIDPHRYWNSKSTGGKIQAGIALLLGGIGSGLNGKSNVALDIINKQIDQDIEAQKSNLGKTANLLAMNRNKYQSDIQALSATKMDMLAAVQAKIASQIAQSSSAQAKAAGEMAIQDIEKQKMAYKQQMAVNSAIGAMATGKAGPGAGLNTELLPKEVRERIVQTPTGPRLAATSKDAEDVKATQATHNKITSKISEAKDFIETEGFSPGTLGIFDTKASSKAEHIKSDIEMSLKDLYGSNRFNEQQYKHLKEMVPSPGAFRSGLAKERLEELQKTVDQYLNAQYSSKLHGYQPGKIKELPTR